MMLYLFNSLGVDVISAQNVPTLLCAMLSGHGKASKLSATGAAALVQGVGYA